MLLSALSLLLSACSTLAYYGQAISGQMEIWHRERPITEMLARDDIPAALRHKLELVVAIREFAVQRLGLPDNGSYRDYADLHREFVVWNVFATPALSLDPVQSCYPFAGCLGYRGFFSRARAQRYAAGLRRRGYDVYAGGVAAYSTLGWFDDPVLNTILEWDDTRIAEILFHELAHQEVYVPGDTTFNESFAMAVADVGVRRWLAAQGRSAAAHDRARTHERALIELLLETREKLARLYRSDVDDNAKRAGKQHLFAELRAAYDRLKRTWHGDTSYDEWMRTDLNNAKIASVATYHDRVAAFMSILHHYDGKLPAFYAAVKRLAALPSDRRTECLDSIARDGDAAAGSCGTVLEQPRRTMAGSWNEDSALARERRRGPRLRGLHSGAGLDQGARSHGERAEAVRG